MTVDDIALAPDATAVPIQQTGRWRRGGLGRVVQWRLESSPPWLLLVELFLAIGWLRAGTAKLVDGAWWSGRELVVFLGDTSGAGLPWYGWFVDEMVARNPVPFAVAVLVVELGIGLTLLVGRRAPVAHLVGLGLVLNFLAAGAVNPSIFYLVLHSVALLWLVEHRHPWVGMLRVARIGAITMMLASLPFVATLQPAHLIEDAAAVLAMFGGLVVVASTAALLQLRTTPV